jgi:hypothetical protein
MVDERRARGTRTGDDVDDAIGQLGFLDELGEQQGGERCGLGGFQHHGVAAGQRGRDLPRGHEQREVPRDDLPGDANALGVLPGEGVAELVGPTGVVEEVRGGERHVHVAAFADGLAAVHAFDHGELAGFLLQQARDAVDVLGAFAAGILLHTLS